MSSGWIDVEEWVTTLPADGRYQWRVSASDGAATSDWTAPRQILLDRTPPWSQMVRAEGRNEFVVVRADAPVKRDDAGGGSAGCGSAGCGNAGGGSAGCGYADSGCADSGCARDACNSQMTAETQPALDQPAPIPTGPPMTGLRLTWWATDTHSGVGAFDLQARELIRASTIYSPIMALTETTRLAYELILSGSEEITRPMIITELMPYTASIPLFVFMPLTDTQWFTFATGIVNTETVFLGTPGSTYEFRVRATDRAGNTQPWYDGYAVQAQIDPRPPIRETFIPLVMR